MTTEEPARLTLPFWSCIQAFREEVARRAYAAYQRSGGRNGRDLDHWLEAEAAVKAMPGRAGEPSAECRDHSRGARRRVRITATYRSSLA